MDGPMTRLIIFAASIVAAAIVVIVVLARVQGTADEVQQQTDIVYKLSDIESEGLCEAVGGTWTAANTPKCA